MPPSSIWAPDILMYNSASESFDSTYQTNVVVTSAGLCTYIPPGIFKSSCPIDITWFPFDDQVCGYFNKKNSRKCTGGQSVFGSTLYNSVKNVWSSLEKEKIVGTKNVSLAPIFLKVSFLCCHKVITQFHNLQDSYAQMNFMFK